mmetsp:Transcript_6924/g.22482  ORF Transcript_6924/g.22482 Transcript_6924/m.22482 type:complete len:215 (-) Transcript_6924:1380-2024(-)
MFLLVGLFFLFSHLDGVDDAGGGEDAVRDGGVSLVGGEAGAAVVVVLAPRRGEEGGDGVVVAAAGDVVGGEALGLAEVGALRGDVGVAAEVEEDVRRPGGALVGGDHEGRAADGVLGVDVRAVLAELEDDIPLVVEGGEVHGRRSLPQRLPVVAQGQVRIDLRRRRRVDDADVAVERRHMQGRPRVGVGPVVHALQRGDVTLLGGLDPRRVRRP